MKVALITGSSSGIGKEIASKLASDYEVILHYNSNYNEALKLKNDIDNKYNRDTLLVKGDLSNEEDINNIINVIYDRYDKIDVLVNNAGIAIDTMFEDKNKDNFMKILEVNLIAPFLLCKKIGLKMKENKEGVIINISSTNGIDTPYVESLDYDASKAGLISLSNNIANYLAPYVRVNTICPGWINTNMNNNLDDDFITSEKNKILLGRFGEAYEVANLVYFLISDEAKYINNSIIRTDGGEKCKTILLKVVILI